MMYKPIALTLAALALAMLPAVGANAIEYGDPLVGNVFVTGFDGWTDVRVPYGTQVAPTWGVLLGDDNALCEANNLIPGPTSGVLGEYVTQNMVNLNYSTTSVYTLTANITTWDDDGYGLVFGYADEDNHFRVGVRQQPGTDSFGFPEGISIQKVVGGAITQLGLKQANTDG